MSKARVTASVTVTVDVEANTEKSLIEVAIDKIASSTPNDWTFFRIDYYEDEDIDE